MEKQRKGFAVMDHKRVIEIASMGGKKAHQVGTAHEWTHEEAAAAGRKGGLASRRSKLAKREAAA